MYGSDLLTILFQYDRIEEVMIKENLNMGSATVEKKKRNDKIYKIFKEGMTHKAIGKKCKITSQAVGAIIRRRVKKLKNELV